MPTVVKCGSCGQVLDDFVTLPDVVGTYNSPSWYEDFYKLHRGKCPYCGHELPHPKEYTEKMKFTVEAEPSMLRKNPYETKYNIKRRMRRRRH